MLYLAKTSLDLLSVTCVASLLLSRVPFKTIYMYRCEQVKSAYFLPSLIVTISVFFFYFKVYC
jgi:hypothetical protein